MVHATNEVVDPIAGTRKVKLEIEHPGIIWSVIAFDADVLEWDLSSEPPKGYQRHREFKGALSLHVHSAHLFVRLPASVRLATIQTSKKSRATVCPSGRST